MACADPAAALRDCLRDFPRFCGLLQIVDFNTGARRPMKLTRIQRLYCAARTGRDIVLKPRKVYFTTLEAARDLWTFLTKPGARVTVVVQSQKKHETLRHIDRDVRLFLSALRAQGLSFKLETEAEGRWTLPSRDATMEILEAGASYRTAQKTGRGTAITRLHLSEVASYEHGAETLASLIGAMPKSGEVTIESTPNGASGYYYEQWRGAVEERTAFTPHFFPWYDHEDYVSPLLPGETIRPEGRMADIESKLLFEVGLAPSRVKWLRERLGELGGDLEKLKQEYPSDPDSCFLASGDQYIPSDLVDQATSYDPIPHLGEEGYSFAGIDFGRTNDLTAIVTLRHDARGHLWLVDLTTCRRTDWDTQVATIFRRFDDWGWRKVALDKTGIGSMPAELVENSLGRQRVEQVAFGENTKEILATTLFAAFAERRLTIPEDLELARDIKAIKRVVNDKGRISYEAPRSSGGHADRAWALALALHAAGVRAPAPPRRDYGYGDFQRGNV